MKTIVLHIFPDLDAITCAWLLSRYLPEWDEADVVFTPQQKDWNSIKPDSNPAIINIATPSPITGRNLSGSDLSSIISDGSTGNEVLFNKSFDKINKTLERLNDHIEAGITTKLYAYGTGSVTEAMEKAANFYKSVYKTKK